MASYDFRMKKRGEMNGAKAKEKAEQKRVYHHHLMMLKKQGSKAKQCEERGGK